MNICFVIRNRTKKLLVTVLSVLSAVWVLGLLNPLVISTFGTMKQRVIVIDPGHGGIDSGASSPGFLEKDINLAIAKIIKAQLQSKGVKVILTRDRDINLDQQFAQTLTRHKKDLMTRVNIIKKLNPDLFLSIHVNSNPRRPSTTGPMVFYNRKNPQSRYLSETVQDYLNQACASKGFRKHLASPGDFYLLNNISCPGAIVEVGFMTNYNEKKMLQTEQYQKQLAMAIVKSVQHYLTTAPKTQNVKLMPQK